MSAPRKLRKPAAVKKARVGKPATENVRRELWLHRDIARRLDEFETRGHSRKSYYAEFLLKLGIAAQDGKKA